MESLAILSLAYTAYMTAELLHWSGIISLIGEDLLREEKTEIFD